MAWPAHSHQRLLQWPKNGSSGIDHRCSRGQQALPSALTAHRCCPKIASLRTVACFFCSSELIVCSGGQHWWFILIFQLVGTMLTHVWIKSTKTHWGHSISIVYTRTEHQLWSFLPRIPLHLGQDVHHFRDLQSYQRS